ncbi:MAG TPA: hypothetical protein VGN70_03490 [Gammaproteobacteria bacterium]|jgi:uncharacterized membrane protein
MDYVEKQVRLRRRLLLVSTVAFAIWGGVSVLLLTPWFAAGTRQWLNLLGQVASIPWFVTLCWLLIWIFRMKAQPQVFAALNDEMTVRNRWRATRATMWVLMLCLMVGAGLTDFVHISAALALMFLIWVLVVSKLGLYLWFDRS